MAKSKNIYGWPIRKNDLEVAVSEPEEHFGVDKFAIDFLIKEDRDIFAVQDGEVIYTKDDSSQGGDDPKYIDHANIITLIHQYNEFSEYVHLKKKGILVKKGEKVKRGQIIAKSGNTGYSTEPHLHLRIGRFTNNKESWVSIEPKFEEKIKIITNLKKFRKKLKGLP